jgi:NAD(P)-dependent dehydrogenase (short-subunit alcohol dehydrogenase family)
LRVQGTLVVAVHPGWVDTEMTAHLTAEKTSPELVVATTLAGIEAGEEEIVPTRGAARIKAALREDPASIEVEAQRMWDERSV